MVGRDDNFFELGGDSLSAVEMTLEVEKLLSRSVPPAFFKNPTLSSLAILLEVDNQTQANKDKFVIESYRKDNHSQKSQKKKTVVTNNLKSPITRKYSLDDFDKIADLLVARYIVSKSYTAANKWTVQWSQNPFVRDFLYRRRYALFSRWMVTLKDCHIQPSDAFQMSMLTNMNFGLSKYLGKKEKSVKDDLQAYKKSPIPYWRTLGKLLEATPKGQLNEYFPISGSDHFVQAYQQGRGVILLTFHGVPTPGRFFALERLLGLEDIPTISYHIPIRQSQYHNREDEMPEAVASTLNAEIALFGQRKLLEGKVINIASDTNDLQGRTYKVLLAERIYQIKAGFAELALNTGAKIVPHFRHCLPDGKIQLSFGAPLEPGTGDRSQQVETLLNGYAAFIENTWATHPEAMRWLKIKRHLLRQSVNEDFA
jgi:lauroyl/myristoyl acyltransferase